MQIKLNEISKVYRYQTLFKNLSYIFEDATSTAIVGGNGSGKSTLLGIIAGRVTPAAGKVTYLKGSEKNDQIDYEDFYQYISWMAPSIGLFSYLSLRESFEMHFRFKINTLSSIEECLDVLKFEKINREKKINQLSSGMLQRAKLGLAIFSQSPVLLLDEPTSFMDNSYSSYMLNLIEQYSKNKILILASNLPQEIERISDIIHIQNHT